MTDVARLRPLMFAIAYRMTGSVAEAEDIVQEAFLRMHDAATAPDSPDAYATTVTTRLAIDHLRSARVRRERYVGMWLPEPLLEPDTRDPAARVELAETVSIAFLVVLERLSPVERAVFVLREAFGYEYGAIAAIVGQTAQTCRQTLSRARAHLAEERPRFEASVERRDELARRFFAACEDGDLAALEKVLAEDIVFYADNAGRKPAIPHPLAGRADVARFLLGLFRYARAERLDVEAATVNGQPGGVVRDAQGLVVAVFGLHIVDGHIASVHNVLSAEKLRHLI